LAQGQEAQEAAWPQPRNGLAAAQAARLVISLAARLVLPTEHLQLSKAAQVLQAMLLLRVLVGVAEDRLTGQTP
jgi:hypothetical protein